ncbi:MAG: low-specificity L-threonine aldolase [Pseudomonadota bacterium]
MIDLRSDTVTQPCAAMRAAMADAPVGDDVYGEDPSVIALESEAAAVTGKAAALFAASGTQTNLLALMSHCERGDEYIVGQDAHTYKYEAGGAAVLGSIQPQPLDFDAEGRLPLAAVEAAIKVDDPHFARTRLLALENTQHGRVVPLDYLQAARELVDRRGLVLHLDGARACNAAVALDTALANVCAPFDSVSICLSKGLGAPVGSVLCGSDDLIHRARRWRKMLGGGMRQAGVLAAAARIALRDGPGWMRDDHRRAAHLHQRLSQLPGATVRDTWQHTNMVWLDFDNGLGPALQSHCREHGVVISVNANSARLVLHRDVDDGGVEQAGDVIAAYFNA